MSESRATDRVGHSVRACGAVGLLLAALAGACGGPAPPALLTQGASGSGGGGGANACQRTTDCAPTQVCSPDGRCVDCYVDADCRADQRCADSVCDACADPKCGTSGGAGGASGNTGQGMSGAGGTSGAGGAPAGGASGAPAGGSGGTVSAGGASGSGGGDSGGCGGTRVLFVVQSSGSMFQQPTAAANYWGMARAAISGPSSVAAPYQSELAMGAMLFVREMGSASACPLLNTVAPVTNAIANIDTAMQANETTYATLMAKLDAPVPEAEAAAAALLGATGARHIILITTGEPDTCNVVDSTCVIDLAVVAVQAAARLGITTHVIGLGNNTGLSTLAGSYPAYLEQLANAGVGQSVQAGESESGACTLSATYGSTSGSAPYYQTTTASDVAHAVQQILASICP